VHLLRKAEKKEKQSETKEVSLQALCVAFEVFKVFSRCFFLYISVFFFVEFHLCCSVAGAFEACINNATGLLFMLWRGWVFVFGVG